MLCYGCLGALGSGEVRSGEFCCIVLRSVKAVEERCVQDSWCALC